MCLALLLGFSFGSFELARFDVGDVGVGQDRHEAQDRLVESKRTFKWPHHLAITQERVDVVVALVKATDLVGELSLAEAFVLQPDRAAVRQDSFETLKNCSGPFVGNLRLDDDSRFVFPQRLASWSDTRSVRAPA